MEPGIISTNHMSAMKMLKWVLIIVAGAPILLGCASQQNRFVWGHYEGLVYKMYHAPSSATPDVQIRKLAEDIRRAEEKNNIVAPGVHAHLGYMHYLNKDVELAELAFRKEMLLYPESTVFMERLLAGLQREKDEQ